MLGLFTKLFWRRPTPELKLLRLFSGHLERWTRNAFVRDQDDNECEIRSPKAAKFCVVGGTILVYPATGSSDDHFRTLKRARDKLFPRFRGASLAHWNDHPDTTFDDVIRVVKAAKL